ncbi:MAG: Protein-tyrosine phosphatase, low molecular weight [Proteobacteria bacterium]|nr:Protein-tyrosine phosphatase, low molecular weight [Pseudomonadota bacterium]
MPEKCFQVLFLCTGNSARSIMAEAILRHVGQARFNACSAGSTPAGEVNPLAIEILEYEGIGTESLHSKNWVSFAGEEASEFDFIFTLCDSAARETCPAWSGQPITAHWGIADPAAVEGADIDKRRAFTQAFQQLYRRINLLVNLPLEKLDDLCIRNQVEAIGQLQDHSV